MKILLIGAKGTIGSDVLAELSKRHEVLTVGRESGEYNCDMSNSASIASLYEQTGKVDAVVCIAGDAKWAPFADMTEEDFYIGIRSKLMGQVNLVKIGQEFVNEGGSFTLTTGVLADDPEANTTSPSMVNGAVHSFVRASSLEMVNNQRINVVAAGLVIKSAEKYRDYFPGATPVSMERVVNAYVRSIEGKRNGEIIRVI